MSHDQQFQLWNGDLSHQKLLTDAAAVSGYQYITVSRLEQDAQTAFIIGIGQNRTCDRDHGVIQAQRYGFIHQNHIFTIQFCQ